MRTILIPLAFVPLSACWPFGAPESFTISGETMGTTYNVTVVDPPRGVDETTVSAAIEGALANVNGKMNNWNPGSEVSQFSASDSTDPVPASSEMVTVMAEANRINALSGGKFDVTLAPLINLWGFGPKEPGEPIPSDAEIEAALEHVGQSTLLTLRDDTLQKALPQVSVNLSAIAKGYGVDAIGGALENEGIARYLVEIGGDLLAKGQNAEDRPWSIGIERPDAAQQTVEVIIPVSDLGLATSGDYRNYFEEDGIRYSHIIDSTTGRPITHTTASVTVLADSAMTADGLATALLVVGSEEALEIAETENVAVMVIDRRDGGFVTSTSPAFDALIAQMEN
ncbi:MAG: FAD:protein FMN transferase [Pseudomonadota bacterium]